MRKLTVALAFALVLGTTGVVLDTSRAAAAYQTKVVIVVGQVQGATAGDISDANAAASAFSAHGAAVTTVYSPHASWNAVKAAASGANIFIYLGHGNGYPNPYVSYLQPKADNGVGLDGPTAGKTYYYGEAYAAQLNLAPNALVILNHLCYASGNSEPGRGNPSLSVAHTRIEGYGSGFLRGGARAVIAEALGSISYYADALYNSPAGTTVESIWQGHPDYHGTTATVSWGSTRNPGYTAWSDPSSHPASDGDVYYRSMVADSALTVGQVLSGQFGTFTLKSGTYYTVSPIQRVVDSRIGHEGPSGAIIAGGGVNYQIAGVKGIPRNAFAITANVTITSQTAKGWLFVGPSVSTAPGPSTVNFPVGDNRANGVTVALSPEGTIGVWYGAAGGNLINVIIDVTGYFLEGSVGATYSAFGPQRVMDTRRALGGTKFVSGHHQKIQIAGAQGLPASGIVAVTGNLTAVYPSALGYVFLGPDPTDKPTSSTLNFPAGDIRANNVVVPVNADGTVSAVYVAASGATVQLVLDITGYFTASGGAQYHVVAPWRMMDSRTPPKPSTFHVFHANQVQRLPVTGGTIPTGAAAITGNLTVTHQTYRGFAAIGPTIDASTNFSNLNFGVGDDRANGVTVPLGTDGGLDIVYAAPNGQTAYLILDVSGYYQKAH